MVKKNDILNLTIEDLGVNGEGIGKVDGYTLFVKDAIIGDEVTVKVMKANKNFGFARLIEINKPSRDRVEPKCSVARQCGGCQLQCLKYQEQLNFKQNKVYNNLTRIGGQKDFVMGNIIGMAEPYHYRNKSQFPVGVDRDGNIVFGFYAGRTHSIINVNGCDLGLKLGERDVNKEVIHIVKSFMEKYHIKPYNELTHKGLVRHLLIRIGAKTKQIMVCVIINGNRLPNSSELVEELCKLEGVTSISLNKNTKRTNVILGDEIIPLYGPGYIEDYIGDVKFRISPLSFFQVNPMQTEKLYNKALEYADLSGNEIVWDLYCGIGSISLFLAKKAKKVLGVEIVPQAIEDAKTNAKINGIENAEFFVGAAEEVVTDYFDKHAGSTECKPDVIVVDPPRKGCDEKLLNTIVKMNPERIVYVSCDSATLARDVKWLSQKGYRLVEVTPCDMFGQTIHVESVCRLNKI